MLQSSLSVGARQPNFAGIPQPNAFHPMTNYLGYVSALNRQRIIHSSSHSKLNYYP